MNKGEYRDLFRRTMRDDIVGPDLFNDDEIDAFVQEAREQAATRHRIVRLSPVAQVPAPAIIPLLNGITEYLLSPSIFRLTRVDVAPVGLPKLSLRASTEENFNYSHIQNRSPRDGVPREYIVDEDRQLVLDKSYALAAGAVIHLQGYKRPDPLIEDDDEDMEIISKTDQTNLMYRAYSRAYLIQDSEVEHMQKSQMFDALFVKAFGAEKTADQLRLQFQYRNRTTKYGGIR